MMMIGRRFPCCVFHCGRVALVPVVWCAVCVPLHTGGAPLALLTGCSGLVCETVGVVCPCESEIGESGKQGLCSGGWSKLLLGWFCLDLGGRVLILG